MRLSVPQRRTSDCECRCHPCRLSVARDLDTANEHQSAQHPPSVQSHLRNFAAAMATCVQPRTTSAARLSTQLCCCELQRRCRQTPGGAARSAWSDSDMHKCRTTNPTVPGYSTRTRHRQMMGRVIGL